MWLEPDVARNEYNIPVSVCISQMFGGFYSLVRLY